MSHITLDSFADDCDAIIVGASGGIGSKFSDKIISLNKFKRVIKLSRRGEIPVDLSSETSIAESVVNIYKITSNVNLIIDCTGFLHDETQKPEKNLRDLTKSKMIKSFTLNAIGPALLMKHYFPILSQNNKSVYVKLSAKVGSISDNKMGGWYSYRSSKAALNQLIRCGSIELKRMKRHAICIAMHPGTVDTKMSKPFMKSNLKIKSSEDTANEMVNVINNLKLNDTGKFFDYTGNVINW